jgi:GT2 family glycosyltransferase/glycosyltransferase involved in cell wall biosynthesis
MADPKARADARTASERGRAALQAGRRDEAVRWLDRAHRVAPNDVSVSFLLASALGGVDDAAGMALLERIIAAHPEFRDAQVALAAAELRAGRPDDAAARLGALLSRSAPPPGEAFARLADAVAQASGAPGWVAATSGGRLTISAAPPLDIRLDDENLPRPRAGSRLLPPRWREAARLSARTEGRHLLGSPIDLAALRRTEGFVDVAANGDLDGFAWLPGDPDAMPELVVMRAQAGSGEPALRIRAGDETRETPAGFGPALPRGFRVAATALPPEGALRVVGADGRDLAGSPLRHADERQAARAAAARFGLHSAAPAAPDLWRPLPVDAVAPGRPAGKVPARAGIDIILPVFRGAADFIACLASLRRELPRGTRIVVVDDASPDAALGEAIAQAAGRREVTLLRHQANRGFPAAVNTGLRHATAAAASPRSVKPRDVVLLNSDTLVPPGAIARLAEAAYSAGDIGSVTPLSCDGTIVSIPRAGVPPDLAAPDLAETDRLDRLARAANGAAVVDLPTAVGFCMFIRHDCLAQTGLLREDAFAQGYGEENDWCLRARHLGWRHVAATGIFVAHLGGRSFGPARSHLLARNLRVLNRLHPGYDAMVAAFTAHDPLAPARRRIDELRWRAARHPGEAVILVTHGLGGGVGRHIDERCAALRAEGLRPVVLHPAPPRAGSDEAGCLVSDGPEGAYPDLVHAVPSQLPALVRLLRRAHPLRVEVHHLLGHAPEIADLAGLLGVPCDVVVHDYSLWCPRIALVGRTQSYCGEPPRVAECEACVADLGNRLREDVAVASLRGRSAVLLRAARHVVVSCADVATRINRQFPLIRPVVSPWEAGPFAQAPDGPAAPRSGETVRIVVPGAIGIEKGYDVLLACARDAARRRLTVLFIVAGHTIDDARLLDTGMVFVTGRYEETEAVELIRRQNAHIAFIPSVWPETWCYALSNAWRAGLPAAAFALGAQAERIAATGTGAVLPLGLPPARVNDSLIGLAHAGGRGLRAGSPGTPRAQAPGGAGHGAPGQAAVALAALARNA